MAVGNPYAPSYGDVATPTPTSDAGISIAPWQSPSPLGGVAGGGFNISTFGQAPGLGDQTTPTPAPVVAAPPPAAPAAPAAPPATPFGPNTADGQRLFEGLGGAIGPAAGAAGGLNGGGGPSYGGRESPSTANDPTGGMAASGDTQASANGGSSASNTPIGDGGRSMAIGIGKGLLGGIPVIGPIASLAMKAFDMANPPPSEAEISAKAKVEQALQDAHQAPAAGQQQSGYGPGADAGTATSSGPGTQGGGGFSSGAASGADSAAHGDSSGQTSGATTSSNGATAGNSGDGAGGTGASGAAGGDGGQGGQGGGDGNGGNGNGGGDGGSSGGGGYARGGMITPAHMIGRSPPPDTGYISARPGEFVVNQAATAKYGPILAAINAGTYDPANPPGMEGDQMSGNGGAPYGMSPQANPGYGSDADTDPAGNYDQAGTMAGPQDPSNTSPLMPFPNSMALSPDAAMQRLASLPMDQRAALAQVTADPTIQGALLSIFGPPFSQFIQAAQAFTPPGAGAGGAAPPPGAPTNGGPVSMDPNAVPSASSGAPGGAVSPGPSGPMPGPAGGSPGAPPPRPFAAGGMVGSHDVRYMPPPYQHSAPPGVKPPMPQTGLTGVGMRSANLAQGGHREMPQPHNTARGQG